MAPPLPHRCIIRRPASGVGDYGDARITTSGAVPFVASGVACFIQVLSIGQRNEYEAAGQSVTHKVYFRPAQAVQAQDRLAPQAHLLSGTTLIVQATSLNDVYRVAVAREAP